MIEPPSTSAKASPLKVIFGKATLPLARLIAALANAIAYPSGHTVTVRSRTQFAEEIRNLVESAEEQGEYVSQQTDLIHSAIDFSETLAREVMTPRTDLDAVSVDSNPYDVLDIIQQSGHSRIPIFEGTDDEIVGIIHAKDLLVAMLRGKPANLRSLMRPALYATENKNILDLLKEMRVRRTQLVVIKDEFGGTSGIVTIEDIVEELVGEIQDEYDTDEPAVTHAESVATNIFEGRTNIDDVNEELGTEIESEDFDTIGGYVFGLFGRQPNIGETITDDNNTIFTIIESDGKRITKLQVDLPTGSTPEPQPLSN